MLQIHLPIHIFSYKLMYISDLMPVFNLPSLTEVPALGQLTGQERKVLLMTLNDFSCKESADTLSIATETVKRHRKNIIRKLEVKGKSEFRRLLYLWTVKSIASIKRVDPIDPNTELKSGPTESIGGQAAVPDQTSLRSLSFNRQWPEQGQNNNQQKSK